jgi:hypothetical protein
MDRVKDRQSEYRKHVKDLIAHYTRLSPESDEVETQVIIDDERDHYQILRTGWRDEEHRVYGCLMHIDIKDGKIWIQRDGTETGVANELAAMGVPKEDIVLAFYPPYRRPHTGFGVN